MDQTIPDQNQVATRFRIEKLVYGGEGLSRIDGEVVFTPFVLPGEEVEAVRSGKKHQAQRAKVVNLVEPSVDRVTPECGYFRKCGGCQYQHASYAAQLRHKREILAETFRRVGRFEFDPERIAVESAEPFGYRNRVQLHFHDGKVGYRAMGSHSLVPVETCSVASPLINEVLDKLNHMVGDRRWPGFVESIEIFTNETGVQWNIAESTRPVAKHFFDWLRQHVPETVPGPLDYTVNGDVFTVSGTSFFQVNRYLAPRLAQLAIGDAQGGTAWDLYAGVGLFSLPLARRFEKVTAVESGRGATGDLERNAARAGLPINCVRQSTEPFLFESGGTPDFILADPPRAGLEKGATGRLLEIGAPNVVIVACDPATLARDLAALQTGYEIESVTLVDLFPQTFHIETITKLRKRGA